MMTNEAWRAVSEFPNYEVSNLGRVRNAHTLQVLKLGKDRKGYNMASLYAGKSWNRRVARLVCIAWHGSPPFEGAQAAHQDGSKDNDTPDNLAWASCKENNAQREAHGTAKNFRGERSGKARYSLSQVEELRRRVRDGEAVRLAAKDLGIHKSSAFNIIAGRSWAWAEQAAPVFIQGGRQ